MQIRFWEKYDQRHIVHPIDEWRVFKWGEKEPGKDGENSAGEFNSLDAPKARGTPEMWVRV